jgi:DNA-binding HxlR family transcriptional regulator
LIRKLYEQNREVVKTSLLPIIPNSYSLNRYLTELSRDGLVNIREEKIVRKTFYVSLTLKGRAVAEQLKRMDEVAARTETYEMPSDFDKEFESLSAITNHNILDDHIAITEHNYDGRGKDRVVMVYVKLNGRGFVRLWCEADNAYDCRHTRFAWALRSVQEMVQIQRDKENMKE